MVMGREGLGFAGGGCGEWFGKILNERKRWSHCI